MAEFKLGRIKFVYQGTWAPSTSYVVDDVVTVGGKTYICVISNTSSSLFATDLNNVTPYWNLVADGSRWAGNWTNGTYYQLGDQVLYGGTVYQCTTAHSSAPSTATITATAFTVSAGTAVLTYTEQPVQPFLVGATITLAGFSPTQTSGTVNTVNTTFTVTSCSTTQVQFALTGTYTAGTLGTVTGSSQLGLEANQSSWVAFATNFNWSNAWTLNTRYKVKDLVTYGGYTYVCNTAHVSANTADAGLEFDSSKWDVFNPGISYQGSWSGSAVRYRLNDIVKYGANLWICTTPHTSTGSTLDAAKFNIFVNGFEFVNSWSSSTSYVIGDIVTYGGNTYTAIQSGSNQNPSTQASYWSPFTSGFTYSGDWNSVTSYQIGDVVRLGGYTYLALVDNQVQTLTITGTTISTDGTRPNQIATSGNTSVLVANLPISFATNTGGLVTGTTYYVKTIVDGSHFTVSTAPGGSVFSITATTSATSITATTNPTPPFSTYWTRLNSGIRWNPTNATYNSVSTTTTSGPGTGATFDVVASKTAYTVTLHSGGGGSSYTTSSILKIAGTSVGGISPANDIVITVTGTSGGAITTFTTTGNSVTWVSGTAYVLGDAVYFGANSYICVSAHIATTGNRPDADTTGTYWNLLASGAEQAVLTTQGDMFYYGANGPTRLPIGTDGQILRVNGSTPAWQYYGQINQLVFVSPNGTDSNIAGQGTTIDKPWASIRYACQQVEDGYLNTNAKMLLTMNKQFMLKEVNNYVQNQYSVNVTGTSSTTITVGGSSTSSQVTTANLYSGMPIVFASSKGNIVAGTTYYVATIPSSTTFTVATSYANSQVPQLFTVGTGTTNTGTYSYSSSKTERDAGLVISGVIFDISHGGTLKSTNNANSFFTSSGSLISGVSSYDIVPFVAALNYLKGTLFTSVLGNTAPTNNYQTLNGVSLGNQGVQQINTAYTAEATAISQAPTLVSIVTSALVAGTNTGVPAVINPNTTIRVTTGTYNEVLPINVPAFTAIVGDELRSTIVQPYGSDPLLATVVPKNAAALTRIKTLIPNLMSNTSITPTSGNTTAQVTSLPAGSTGSTTAINNLQSSFTTLYELVASGLGGEPTIVMPTPTGYNTSSLTNTAYATTTGSNSTGDTTGYGYAVAQIQQNYAFLIADTLQYITNNYSITLPALGTRDIRYILDSVLYDLTYGGNSQSLTSGAAYYSLYQLQITSSQVAGFTAGLSRLKSIINLVSQKLSVASNGGVTAGNNLAQNTAGTAGSAAAGGFAQDRIQNVINWINNGYADSSVAPYTGWTSSALQTAYSAVTSAATNIASDATVWVSKFYQSVVFVNSSLINRDALLITNALAYDMIFGTNFNAIQAGRAFNRANTSATNLRSASSGELPPTLGAINFLYYKTKQIAASGAVAQIQTTIDDINNYLAGGKAPLAITWSQAALPQATYTNVTGASVTGGGDGTAAFTITRASNGNGYYNYVITPTTAGASYTTSSKIRIYGDSIGGQRTTNDIVLNVTQVSTGGVVAVTYSDAQATTGLLESNRAFLLAEVIAYINANYSSITSNPNYTVAKTQRDAGYVLDAIHYDMTYGGNWASQNAGMAYYSALYGTQIASGLTTAFAAALGYVSTLAQSVIQGTTVVSPLQVTVPQVLPTTSSYVGSSRDAGRIGTLMTLVTNFVSNGLTSGAPTITVTTIASGTTFTTGSAHGLNVGDIVIPQTSSNGLVSTIVGSGTPYFVASTPLTTTFTLSASYGGSAITSFTNGTGLSIALQVINMPYLGWVNGTSTAAYTAVSGAVSTYQTSVVNYINTNYPALTYSTAYAQRDVFNVTLASMLDMMLGSNYASVQAGRAYNRTQDYQVLGYEKTATVQSLYYLQTLIASSLASYSTQLSLASTAVYLIINMLQNGSGQTPEVNGSVSYNDNLGIVNGAEILRANIPFLASEVVAYYNTTYGGAVSNIATAGNVITTGSNHNLSVNDPIVFSSVTATTTATASSGNNITVGSIAGMVIGEAITFGGTLGNIVSGQTYYLLTASGTTITITSTAGGNTPFSVGTTTGQNVAVTAGGVTGGLTMGTTYYVLSVPSTTTFTVTTSEGYANANTGATGTAVQVSNVYGTGITVNYAFNVAQTKNDITYFLNAIVYDLQYTGNYRSLRAARVLANAVNGSAGDNMWLVRNACGIRNMTLTGLTGTLPASVNGFGTKRPTGGAFTSLDPGFGPNDSDAWVYGRSCYVQNCTMFGYAVVGARVDGALHAGGYRSMVANDYTCIIGDGLGWHTTGAGSLSELVSVFNYYSYAGYLAELGGRIRATNGNSSYGTYGVVAEGTDTTETPIYGTLNNRSAQAQITNVFTDTTNQVLRYEYENAGSNYTNSVSTISGSGYNATAVHDEFRDSSVFETRLIDTGTVSNSLVGGTSYVTVTNVSQGGTTGNITIAATDSALTNAYNGMRVTVIAGTGVGQYGNILTYQNGTKTAQVVKDAASIVNITSTSSTNNLLTVASTANLYVGMPIYLSNSIDNLTGAWQGSSAPGLPTLYYVIAANFSATQFAVSTSSGGSAVTLSGVAGSTVTVTATNVTNNLITATNTLTAGRAITFSSSFNGIDAGVTYFVLPTNLTTSSFSVSTYLGGPAVTITATGSASSTGTIATSLYAAGWDHVVLGTVIINTLDLTTGYTIEPRITYSAPGYTATGRTLATSTTWSGVTYGASKYVAVATGGTATNYSNDGKTWSAGGALPSSTSWTNVVYGGGQGANATAVVGGFGGSGASFSVTIGTGLFATQIVSITVTNGGYNYTTPPTIVIVGGGGSGATATCTVLNGAIQTVTMVINGSGYTSAPTVTAVTSALTSVTVNNWGKNYYSTPTITFSQPQGLSPVAFALNTSYTTGQYIQTAAGRIYYVSAGGTSSVSVTPTADYTTSSGYTGISNGSLTLNYIATQAQATPTLTNAGVSAITLSVYGYGYTTIPTVTILDTAAKFVTVSSATTAVAYSTVAGLTSTWSSTVSDASTNRSLKSVAYGNGYFVAVGGASATGTAVSSSDGVSWINRSASQSNGITALSAGYYSAVAYGSGTFVAVNNGGLVTSFSTNSGASWTQGGNLPSGFTTAVSITYGANRFVVLGSDGRIAYSLNNGVTWIASSTSVGTTTSILSSSYTWSKISYGQGLFFAIAQGTTVCATSGHGVNWTLQAMPSSSNWQDITLGNVTSATLGAQPLWVAVSATSGTVAASIRTGATTVGRMKVTQASGVVNEIRLIEPGSGYPKGNVTTTGTALITVDDTTNLSSSLANNQPIEFTGMDSYGLTTNVTYYVIGSTVTSTQFSVSATLGGTTPVTLTAGSGLTGTYRAGPVVTQIDPNKVTTAGTRVRMGDGALGNPTFTNRGSNNATATATTLGDGFADLYQNSQYIAVSGLYSVPSAGANVQFSTITGSNQWYKLVTVTNILGNAGSYTAQFTINPALTTLLAPTHNTLITTRLKYSQVRLTGHDFLYIGTGNQTQTNYPYVIPANAIQANQELNTGGGRTFFTSTDQDGNFNVGNLFGVQQSTGTATLNASAFNLAGLQSLTLGAVSLGVGSATITQFSTDPYFTANSDNVLPTQKAIKSFITAQIGGGSSSLNVNTITSGQIYIANNTISNTTGNQIYVSSKMLFTGGIDGSPVALVYFGQK